MAGRGASDKAIRGLFRPLCMVKIKARSWQGHLGPGTPSRLLAKAAPPHHHEALKMTLVLGRKGRGGGAAFICVEEGKLLEVVPPPNGDGLLACWRPHPCPRLLNSVPLNSVGLKSLWLPHSCFLSLSNQGLVPWRTR